MEKWIDQILPESPSCEEFLQAVIDLEDYEDARRCFVNEGDVIVPSSDLQGVITLFCEKEYQFTVSLLPGGDFLIKDSSKLANDTASILMCAVTDYLAEGLNEDAFTKALFQNFPKEVANHVYHLYEDFKNLKK